MRSIVSLRLSMSTGTSSTARIVIAREHAGTLGGRVFDRLNDFDDAVLERDFDADAGILAGGADADLVEFLRRRGTRSADRGRRSCRGSPLRSARGRRRPRRIRWRTCSSTSASSRASCHGTGCRLLYRGAVAAARLDLALRPAPVRPTDRPKPGDDARREDQHEATAAWAVRDMEQCERSALRTERSKA